MGEHVLPAFVRREHLLHHPSLSLLTVSRPGNRRSMLEGVMK